MDKVQSFLIYVRIIEGRHFALANMDSVVHIRIGKEKKTTIVRKFTDCPYFNEYFVFEFNTTLESLLDEHVILTVIQPGKMWRRRRVIGYFKLDVATIWIAPEHQYYHKWVVIAAGANENKPGPKGYIKLDIGIVSKGEKPHFPVTSDSKDDDDIEGNLLLPEKSSHDRCRANFIFSIYSADEIPKMKGNACRKLMDNETPSTFVQITFAGLKGKTSVKKSTQSPVWNEKLILSELFPSLCQRIKIELKFLQNVPPLVHFIYLNSISNDGENGFLPTFGPAYIYLYSSDKSEINYSGKLLLEINTEILTDLMWNVNSVEILQIRQIPNLQQIWQMEPVLLFCNIYSTTMIDKKFSNKPISFEITMGPRPEENSSILSENISISMKPLWDNKKIYLFLPLKEQILSLSMLLTDLYDTRFRIYNINMLTKMYNLLKTKLDKIEKLFEKNYKNNKEQIDALYITLAEKLESNCRIYEKLANTYSFPKTELDENVLQLCIKEIVRKIRDDIESNISTIIHYKNRKKIFRKLVNILYRIQNLIDDIQICWPDIFIWMLSGNKRVGYYRIKPKDVISSTNPEEKGLLCGKPTNKTKVKFVFGEDSQAVLCKLKLQIWVGLNESKSQCLETMLNDLEILETSEKYDIPTKLNWNESYIFNCNVYMYQGKFEPGADYSGLSDPFVQVIFNELVLQTKMISKTIHPVWNETLIFEHVTIFGSKEFLTKNTPIIILEVYDHDIHNLTLTSSNEFIGRCELIPEVFFEANSRNIPKLHWIDVKNGERVVGELLTTAELILETSSVDQSEINVFNVSNIPANIKPSLCSFKLDVYFWGVHDLKKVNLQTISKPKVIIECAGVTLQSTTIQNALKFSNFQKPYQSVLVTIPEIEEFYPPLSINMFDCRGFGFQIYIGTYLTKLQDFVYKPITKDERLKQMISESYAESSETDSTKETEGTVSEEDLKMESLKRYDVQSFMNLHKYFLEKVQSHFTQKRKKQHVLEDKPETGIDLELIDWWTKFYLSTERSDMYKDNYLVEKLKIKIYPCELESIDDFNHFFDLFKTFKLYRGKRSGDDALDEDNTIATFKGAIRIFKWPPDEDDPEEYITETGHLVEDGTFQHYPLNEAVSFVARVYIIRGINLRPKDISGKSDPYLCVKLGDKEIIDKENYVAHEVNPVFGRCFELKGIFPNDNLLTITVWDWDISTRDDLIGETKIDLENRLYSNHRACCGLPKTYIHKGPCSWRDQHKPSQILEFLCKRNKLDDPKYFANSVKVASKLFINTALANPDKNVQKEILSLIVLNRWKDVPLVGCTLVPEHIETRSLYHYSKPGLEQGKLQLWVDVFPSGDLPPPPPVNIKPRSPDSYELRIIVWNTEDVILEEDDFFVGQSKSDIYVKGWITDPEDYQCTDVHYNSINGEGNFNWRFIFPFLYEQAEDKIIIKKTSTFSFETVQYKIPCFLNLQIWDNDTFNADDFLGSLKLSLSRLPRGAKNSKLCSLNMLEKGVPCVNLFKTKRHKGWWPFKGKDVQKNETILAGKIEIELEILNEYEYKMTPAGLGRSDPQGLPRPLRPDLSFSWFRNPLKALQYLVCNRFRTKIVLFLVIAVLIFMGIVTMYSIPNYLMKRLIGA